MARLLHWYKTNNPETIIDDEDNYDPDRFFENRKNVSLDVDGMENVLREMEALLEKTPQNTPRKASKKRNDLRKDLRNDLKIESS